MLAACCDSLATQTSDDWTHTLIHDEVGRGIAWANGQLAAYADKLVGDWIWILDDDDLCTYDKLVEELPQFSGAEVVIVRADHSPRHGILPEPEHWGWRPVCGHVGMSNFIVRREVYQAHAERFAIERLADCAFIRSVWDANCYRWSWWDVVAMRLQRGASFGRGEDA